ncbi:SdpI family protein [Leifsonia aquatica]|uniref:SdpI family protein n=1 Tax=Leifsonia aquatica TaxID=144185 RepID=UPI003816AF43
MVFGLVVGSAAIVVIGSLVLWLARACRSATLPRNWILGYRTAVTLRDANAWAAVNRAPAPYLFIAGIGMIVAALAGLLLALAGATDLAPGFLGSACAWLILWVVVGYFPALRAERAYKRRP